MRNIFNVMVFLILLGFFGFTANDWQIPWAGKPVHGQDWCETHQVKLSLCDKCNPKLARAGTLVIREREPQPGECPNTLVRITLATDVAKQIGLQFHTVEQRNVAETIRANAETQYAPGKYARIASRISGVMREAKVVLGDEVEPGTILALLDSAEFAQAKTEYLQALAVMDLRKQTHEREKSLSAQKVSTLRELQEAHTAFVESAIAVQRSLQKLRSSGLSAEQINAVKDSNDTSAILEIRAPFQGIVVESSAVTGEIATTDKPIFAVADMERLWLTIDVYEADIARVEKGQRVKFRVEGMPGQNFSGKVMAIGSEVNDKTRTVPVFADIKNSQNLLRTNMFGQAEITVKPVEPKLLIPKDAIHSDDDGHLFVFVSPLANIFQSRAVQTGTVYEAGYEVLSGLSPQEKVVTTGSFLLKSEVMRGQMGAG
jgi:cobalt-zinc-cadmium efflux system membrane fusion protein